MRRLVRRSFCLAVLLATLLPTASANAQASMAVGPPGPLRVAVLARLPHDTAAFTQGLVISGGYFYESTGLYGQSTLRQVDIQTGQVIRQVSLPEDEFGEGLALADGRLIQLTWQSGVAYEYDVTTLEETNTFTYEGEGWGLCYDGERLIMSDGTGTLQFRSPTTFALIDSREVTENGAAVTRLNELECVNGLVYANVWQTDDILVIDPDQGRVRERIDASGLLSVEEQRDADVLNGIAYEETTQRFYLTGKRWPSVFEVLFETTSASESEGRRATGSCAVAAVSSPLGARPAGWASWVLALGAASFARLLSRRRRRVPSGR